MEISVIMGAYNIGKNDVLYKAINSILKQTFENFEFIICDDGSNDGTFNLLKEISKKDSRIIIISNEKNLGLAATLNRCLEKAKGIYIARMDADDISLPDRLEREYKVLKNNDDYSFVGCGAFYFNSSGVYGKRILKENPNNRDFLFNSPFMHPTILIKKEVLLEVGGYRISNETTRMEDYDLFMRLYLHNHKGYNIQECLYLYREDYVSLKKRKYKYRIDEAIVRYKGFKSLNLLPAGIIFVLKPLLVGLIPGRLLARIRMHRMEESKLKVHVE